jgi:acetyltransferase-like isoleucine patch superfamily enzyme
VFDVRTQPSLNRLGVPSGELVFRQKKPKLAQVPALSPLIDYGGRWSYGLSNFVIHSWDSSTRLSIGSFCSVAGNVHVLLGGEHRTDWMTTFPFGHLHNREFPLGSVHGRTGHPATRGDISIENDVWIGNDVTLLSGTTVADGVVVGARAVIKGRTEPYGIYVGNPAQLVRFRFNQEIIDLLLELRWWELDDDAINELVPALQQPPTVEQLRLLVKRLRG